MDGGNEGRLLHIQDQITGSVSNEERLLDSAVGMVSMSAGSMLRCSPIVRFGLD